MPRRTRKWIWTGRVAAVLIVIGLAGYMYAVGPDQAGKLAVPASVVIALAALFAPYLLPAYQSPTSPPTTAPAPESGNGGIVFIASHNSVAGQYIGDVTMNPPRPDLGGQATR